MSMKQRAHVGRPVGRPPDAWAVTEEQQTPVYEEALRRTVGPRRRVLDVGCGPASSCACARTGARRSGLDAAAGLLELARARVPEADLRLDDLQALPYSTTRSTS
jgi:trans-aconitate methyltransferase